MLSRLPWTPEPEGRQICRPKSKRRLNRDRHRQLVVTVAAILRTGDPTPFAFEATCRHSLRSRFCLDGWKWIDADAMANEITQLALLRIGAKRPLWEEGQPEYVQLGAGALIERYRCVRCHGPLPEGHFKFCSRLCGQSHREMMGRRQVMSEDRVIEAVVNPKRYSQWF